MPVGTTGAMTNGEATSLRQIRHSALGFPLVAPNSSVSCLLSPPLARVHLFAHETSIAFEYAAYVRHVQVAVAVSRHEILSRMKLGIVYRYPRRPPLYKGRA